MEEEILVSICCITYNHEKYIRDALDSFLMQKTSFKYEIIIHDDASTDKTASIIKEYEKKYPDKIKAIYQKENQYSKGIQNLAIVYKSALGKYIAVCEGDDYWTDENKLQKQVDYMEKNPECSFCFHNARYLDMKNSDNNKNFLPFDREHKKYLKKDNKYNVGELALLDQIPTASYFFKNIEFPKWFEKCFIGDLPTQLIATNFGYAYYIDEVMCVYRIGTGISATDEWRDEAKNNNKEIERLQKCVKLYNNINEYCEKKYNDTFDKLIADIEVLMFSLDSSKKKTLKEYKVLYKKVTGHRKLQLVLRMYFKGFYYFLKKIKNKR